MTKKERNRDANTKLFIQQCEDQAKLGHYPVAVLFVKDGGETCVLMVSPFASDKAILAFEHMAEELGIILAWPDHFENVVQ
jgi:hypothetical protein